MDEALDRLSAYRFTDGPGMAVHAPMGAEALTSLGMAEAVPAWVDAYAARHVPIEAPPRHAPLADADGPVDGPATEPVAADAAWRAALGDPARLTDWSDLFGRLLVEEPWPSVVARWVPRLVAGYAGALTHGLLRTAHAVRTLEASGDRPSALALGELATGLAYWAGTYRRLPGAPRPSGRLDLAAAIEAVPRPAEPWSPLEAGTFARLHELGGFPAAVDALAPPASPDPVGDLTLTFSRALLARPAAVIPLVHTVTPAVASRTLLPYAPELTVAALYAQLWQVDAAIVAGFTSPGPALPPRTGDDEAADVPTPGDLAAQAAAHGDPHAVKFTEAALREHAHRPDDTYLLAARQVLVALPPW